MLSYNIIFLKRFIFSRVTHAYFSPCWGCDITCWIRLQTSTLMSSQLRIDGDDSYSPHTLMVDSAFTSWNNLQSSEVSQLLDGFQRPSRRALARSDDLCTLCRVFKYCLQHTARFPDSTFPFQITLMSHYLFSTFRQENQSSAGEAFNFRLFIRLIQVDHNTFCDRKAERTLTTPCSKSGLKSFRCFVSAVMMSSEDNESDCCLEFAWFGNFYSIGSVELFEFGGSLIPLQVKTLTSAGYTKN